MRKTSVTIISVYYLLGGFVVWGCRAFSRPLLPSSWRRDVASSFHHHHHHGSFAAVTPLRSSVETPSSSSVLELGLSGGGSAEKEEEEQQQVTKSSIALDLDADGKLFLDDGTTSTVLLNGLTPSIWSASYPNSTATTTTAAAEAPRDSLFLHASYPQERAVHETKLGNLVSCSRLLACARVTRYWMGPRVGRSARDIPFDTQFLLFEIEKDVGPYVLMLPLVDNGFRASLNYDEDSCLGVVCAAESGDAAVTASGMRALYVAVDSDPYQLLKRGFAQVAEATGTFCTLDNKVLPASVDKFGWCTWDAFYSKVQPLGVLEGVKMLREAGTPPRQVILDDGWQQVTPNFPPDDDSYEAVKEANDDEPNKVLALLSKAVSGFYENYVKRAPHGSKANKLWRLLSKTVLKQQLWEYFDKETDFNRQLNGFLANEKFESNNAVAEQAKSLKNLVAELKDQLGVEYVFCWHALHGYWRGISKELGKAAGLNVTQVIPKPSVSLLKLEPQLAWDTVSLFGVGLLSTEADLAKFYQRLHTPLVEAGVDGVKVDVQSGVSAVGGGVGGGPHLARLYTNAMEDSVSQRFTTDNGAASCINCMCHSTENLYRYRSTSIARASDDFYPTRPDSHTVHLVNVAYNSLFIGEICLPDWDMFHSFHSSAGLHAAARAVGGCPVYVSDAPGKHDPDILRKLVLPDGSVLRAELPGRPTRDCLFVDVATDGKSVLKVWNKNHYGGVLGAFHVQGVAWNYKTHENEIVNPEPNPLTAQLKPHDIDTLRGNSGPFAAWRHRTSKLEFLLGGDSILEEYLTHREWEVFTVVPIKIYDDIMWGPIGLVNMLNSGGALLEVGNIQRETNSFVTIAQLTIRGPGRFVAFTNHRPTKILLNGAELSFTHSEDNCELSLMVPNEVGDSQPHHITVQWS